MSVVLGDIFSVYLVSSTFTFSSFFFKKKIYLLIMYSVLSVCMPAGQKRAPEPITDDFITLYSSLIPSSAVTLKMSSFQVLVKMSLLVTDG